MWKIERLLIQRIGRDAKLSQPDFKTKQKNSHQQLRLEDLELTHTVIKYQNKESTLKTSSDRNNGEW